MNCAGAHGVRAVYDAFVARVNAQIVYQSIGDTKADIIYGLNPSGQLLVERGLCYWNALTKSLTSLCGLPRHALPPITNAHASPAKRQTAARNSRDCSGVQRLITAFRARRNP